MADWWDSISDGFSSVTDWLGGSGGKALTTGAGLVSAGFDIYQGIQNSNLTNKYGNIAYATAKKQDQYSDELWNRQKESYWPLEDMQNQLTTNQYQLALSPDMWNQYAYSQQLGSKYSTTQAQLAYDQLAKLSPLYQEQAQYALDRGLADISQQRQLDDTYYNTEKSVVRKLTEGEDVLRDRMMSQAEADNTVAFANQGEQMRQALGLAGIGTSSQQYANSLTQLKQSQALSEASARTTAARTAEDTALSRQSQALNYRKGALLPSMQYTPNSNMSALTGGTSNNSYLSGALSSSSSSAGSSAGLANLYNNSAQQNWTGLGFTLQNLTNSYIKK